MYEFNKFVETRDYITSFRKESATFLNEQESAYLATLNDEEVMELLEAWYNPASWNWPGDLVRGGLQKIGGLWRGIANIPAHLQAGYHGINTTATNGVNTQDFKNQLVGKQYGVNVPTGKINQAKFDQDIEKAKVAQMDPQAAQQYYQQQQANLVNQKNVQTAQNDFEKAKLAGQPKVPAKGPTAPNAKAIMAALSGLVPKTKTAQLQAALAKLGIK